MGEADASQLAEQFNKTQRMFCPANFEIGDPQILCKDRVVPILTREEINEKGGTAILLQVGFLEESLGPQFRMRVRDLMSVPNRKDDLGLRCNFALKSLDESHRMTYENEGKAYRRLRGHRGIVEYFTAYEVEDVHNAQNASSETIGVAEDIHVKLSKTYNILLEYAECDLLDYYRQQRPPRLQQEHGAFWRRTLPLADALECIHNLKDSSTRVVEEFHGWHTDIKPENILSVRGEFKIGDLGFAKFIPKRGEDPTAQTTGGTESYGAPERYMKGSQTILSQEIDIWSLGCVFSIAATWAVLGCEGVENFNKYRISSFGRAARNAQRGLKLRAIGNYFHDGKDFLPEIKSWHDFLRENMRKSDKLTSQVLDLVDEKMLIGSPEHRIGAKALCAHMREIRAQIDDETNKAKDQDPIIAKTIRNLSQADQGSAEKFLERMMQDCGGSRPHVRPPPLDPLRETSRTGMVPTFGS